MAGMEKQCQQPWPFPLRCAAVLTGILVSMAPIAEEPRQNPAQTDPRLEVARLRSEGTAHFENGTNLSKALEAFEAAARMRPASAIDAYNLGITYRRIGNPAKAEQLLVRAQRLDPAMPQAYYALGLLYRARGELDSALTQFQSARRNAPAQAAVHYELGRVQLELGHDAQALQAFIDTLQLDAQHPGALYQLFLYYEARGEVDRAARMREEFTRVRQALSQSRRDPNHEENAFAGPLVDEVPRAMPADSAPVLVFRASEVRTLEPAVAFDVRDADRDGKDDLIVASRAGIVRLLRQAEQRGFREEVPARTDIAAAPLQAIAEMLIRGESPRLLLANSSGIYVGKSDLRGPAAGVVQVSRTDASRGMTLADMDHDGDLDIVVGPFEQVLLSDGNGSFRAVEYLSARERAELARFSQPVVAGDFLDRSAIDFVLRAPGGERRLVTDRLGGKHAVSDTEIPAALAAAIWSAVADMDNDGKLDILTVGGAGLQVDYHRQPYQFASLPPTPPVGGAMRAHEPGAAVDAAAVLGDFDNDGWKDVLLLQAGKATTWWRNLGARRFDARPLPALLTGAPSGIPIAADIDGDAKLDVVVPLRSGAIDILRNESSGLPRALRLDLTGWRSSPSALHARVEVRRGSFYALYISDGRSLHVPLGAQPYAEVMRIGWPSGLAESKVNVRSPDAIALREPDRISGSCPSIFAWDGTRFRFMTDGFISGPMGVPFGSGYFPVDHDEYIKIPGTFLAPDAGRLRIAITEELREAVFIDQARLLAIDVPAAHEVYPNEALLPGVNPEFKLHLAATAQPPASAIDHNGRDVTELVSRIDRRYPVGFGRLQYEGVAQPHWVEFTLPDGASSSRSLRVFITGWFHYFESTSLVAVSQRGDLPLDWPHIEVRRGDEWQRLLDVGIPPGKGKTVVVDLAGRLPPGTSRLRLKTNLALYWDRILVDVGVAPIEFHQRELPLVEARLRFKGFSSFDRTERGEGLQPERFDYDAMKFSAPWNPLRGRYTRYGAVNELLQVVDSKLAVFGSGDELALAFDARDLGPARDGWRREYLLYLDGYVKDGDKYTAHPGTLQPVPYAGMSSYPYEAGEASSIFLSPEYQAYLTKYQTREPLRYTGPALAPPDSR